MGELRPRVNEILHKVRPFIVRLEKITPPGAFAVTKVFSETASLF